MSEARAQTFDGLYQALGTRDGKRSIYRLAKGRERKTREQRRIRKAPYRDSFILF